MSTLRVLGIGSPFGDDQLGWMVIQLLQKRPALAGFLPDQLQLIGCDRPGMHLIELMRHAQTVFLIDAVKTGSPTGTLHRFQNEEMEAIGNALSTHAFSIAEAMKIGAILKALPPTVILYGIEIGDVQLEFTLSETIMQAIHTLSVDIERDILALLTFKQSID